DMPVPLEGYRGDKREQKAHIIIPRKQVGGASNDVGFEKTECGFKLHASAFDKAWRTGNKIDQLRLNYSEKRIMKTIRKKTKFTVKSREVDKSGKIKIRIRRTF
ncbi:MAG: DUF1257 domain-containing protein, partial [Clostridiales bacterium]|nr:DUF1257 domain-containing protein [Clostridiales bacterium]